MASIAKKGKHQVYSVYNQHQTSFGIPIQLEISNKEQVEKIFGKVAPEVVVHAATLTDVDKCELDRELAWKINVVGTQNIAKAARSNNAFFLYISTDYVFNGEAGYYKETDLPDPINYYGLTKLKAEEKVRDIISNHCIVRASVIYGATPAAGKVNFALWIINSLKKGEKVKCLVDQWNSPTLNTSLAKMTMEIIEKKLNGTFHLSGATRISRYDFAKMMAQTFSLDTTLIVPTALEDFSWIARRPRDSSLNTSKAEETLENKPLAIEQALQELKTELSPLPTKP